MAPAVRVGVIFFMPVPLLVFIGGGLGSLCRYFIGVALAPFALRFPLATLCANFFAACIMGAALAFFEKNYISDAQKWLLTTGFCGGFSTFSTFAAETTSLAQNGHWLLAGVNIILNLAFCLVGFALVRYLYQT